MCLFVSYSGKILLFNKTMLCFCLSFQNYQSFHVAVYVWESSAGIGLILSVCPSSVMFETCVGERPVHDQGKKLPLVRDEYSLISDEWIYKSICPTGRVEFAEKKDVLFH